MSVLQINKYNKSNSNKFQLYILIYLYILSYFIRIVDFLLFFLELIILLYFDLHSKFRQTVCLYI